MDPTLHQVIYRRHCQATALVVRAVFMAMPTAGQRNTQKIFGAVDLYRPRFYYAHGQVFEGDSYTMF